MDTAKAEKVCFTKFNTTDKGTEQIWGENGLEIFSNPQTWFGDFIMAGRKQNQSRLNLEYPATSSTWGMLKLHLRYQLPLKLPVFHISGFNVFK